MEISEAEPVQLAGDVIEERWWVALLGTGPICSACIYAFGADTDPLRKWLGNMRRSSSKRTSNMGDVIVMLSAAG